MRVRSVMGVRVDVTDVESACERIEQLIKDRGAASVCFANAHLIDAAQRDAAVDEALRGAELVMPDGAPVAWAAGTGTRVTGSDVFDELNLRAAARDYGVFLLGSTESTLDALRRSLLSRYDGLTIVGAHAPPFATAAEFDVQHLVELVEDANADIIWLGLGAPKQELVMAEMRRRMTRGVLLGVGAVFDFASGTRRRAPRWMQRTGLEWLHRLAIEPRRLGRRYLVGNTRFVAGLAAYALEQRGRQ